MSLFVPPRVAPRVLAPEKAVLGPGAASMLTLAPLWTALGQKPQQVMKQAQQLYLSNPWIFASEEVVSSAFASVEWHLEDEKDEEVNDAYPNEVARRCRDLFEKPQDLLAVGSKLTRRELWKLTARDMGVCGSGFWLEDQQEALAHTPAAFLYINPVRMTPAEDEQGNLTGWVLDYRDAAGTGIPLSLDEVLHFKLAPPVTGHFGVGKVQTAMSKAALTRLADGHAIDTLESGGRMGGVISAKQGGAIPDTQYQQLIRDLRTVAESPQAAKRMTVVQGPIDFTRTAANATEMNLLELMKQTKEDILALWGVPLSQIGGSSPAGLNSGDTRKYDEAALWQNAVHPRIVAFWEVIQYQLIDRFKRLGVSLHLEIDEPEFDDDSPRYDLLAKAVNLPMRNSERRALIGLDPFGDPMLDDEIILPGTLVVHSAAPEETEPSPSAVALGRAPVSEETRAGDAAGETSDSTPAAKAHPVRTSMTRLRANVERKQGPRISRALAVFLAEQRREITAKVRVNGEHIIRKPTDQSKWWNGKLWDEKLKQALLPHLGGVAETVTSQVGSLMAPPEKAKPEGWIERVLAAIMRKGGARITDINNVTRDAVQALISQGVTDELSVAALGDSIEAASAFDEYRAERIGRTEMMQAYNEAALGSYGEFGVTEVEAIDGDEDPECDRRDGRTFSLDEAASEDEDEHPNGTLDWVPVMA